MDYDKANEISTEGKVKATMFFNRETGSFQKEVTFGNKPNKMSGMLGLEDIDFENYKDDKAKESLYDVENGGMAWLAKTPKSLELAKRANDDVKNGYKLTILMPKREDNNEE